MIISYFLNLWQTYVIDGFIERRLMQRWRLKKSRHKLPYVAINDELQQQTHWPPVPSQRGCSLVNIMRLENASFFQAEQADEALIPATASGDNITDMACTSPQTELLGMNSDILRKNDDESCRIVADCHSKPIGLETLSGAVKYGEPRPYDGTVLWHRILVGTRFLMKILCSLWELFSSGVSFIP